MRAPRQTIIIFFDSYAYISPVKDRGNPLLPSTKVICHTPLWKLIIYFFTYLLAATRCPTLSCFSVNTELDSPKQGTLSSPDSNRPLMSFCGNSKRKLIFYIAYHCSPWQTDRYVCFYLVIASFLPLISKLPSFNIIDKKLSRSN